MKNIFRFLFVIFCLFISTNQLNAQWSNTNGPWGGSSVSCLAISGTNLFAGTGENGVFLSTNNFTSWTAVNTGLTNKAILSLAVIDTNLFAGTLNGVFLTTDNGTSWTEVSNGLTKTPIRALAVNGTNLFAGTSGGVFLSTNSGTNWTAASTGIPNENDIYSLAVIGTKIFAGCNGVGNIGGGVYLSNNNGTIWTVVREGLLSPAIWDLAVSDTNLFAGTNGGGTYLSSNYGTIWTAVNAGITVTNGAGDIAVSGTSIFRSVYYSGVFLSIDNGTSWTTVNSGFPNETDVRQLIVNETYLFGSVGGAVYKRRLSEMVTSVQTNSTELPSHFNLGQNYPNPFNPSTTISFSLSSKSFVSLKVFDLTGRELTTVVSEELPAGNYKCKWNADGMPSGVYFYRLQVGLLTETKKLVLLR